MGAVGGYVSDWAKAGAHFVGQGIDKITGGSHSAPTPIAPPPPPDLAAAYFQGIARAKTNQGLRAGSGRVSSFLSLGSPPPGDAYGITGSKTTTGS